MTGFLPGRNGAKAPAPIASPRTWRGCESYLYQYQYNKSATTQSACGFQHINVEECWPVFKSGGLQAPVVPAIRRRHPSRTPGRNSARQRHTSPFYPVCPNALCLTLAAPLATSISAAADLHGAAGKRRQSVAHQCLNLRRVRHCARPLQTRRGTLHECAPPAYTCGASGGAKLGIAGAPIGAFMHG